MDAFLLGHGVYELNLCNKNVTLKSYFNQPDDDYLNIMLMFNMARGYTHDGTELHTQSDYQIPTHCVF